ncbi:hypothetical protein [Peribacillus sp. NPDC097295]|uniref:hypothetical protein n=1 Tax=Peribacillus sp. NPDC097295 TaxID=3364402 RepID=UPI00382EE65C
MTEWNEQAAPNNNLKASDRKPGRYVEGRQKSVTADGDEQPLKDKKIQGDILEQNL